MTQYIEREKALEECDWYANEFSECEYAIMPLKGALENLPAADVRPVVRGKWVESKSMMEVVYCSECGFRTIYGAMPEGLGRNYSYCPNCGADMREES